MSIERAKQLLKRKENINLEFKKASTALPGNLFETICAMLNREGGDILLGVEDDGTLTGIDPTKAEGMVKDLVNLSNNPEKLDPPFILFPQVHEIEGNTIIHIQVPASSQIHKTKNVVFDRSNDGDFKISKPHQIVAVYNLKRTYYTENTIYPFARFEDFNENLFPKIRNLISSNKRDHPWLNLSDEQLLRTAGLWQHDPQTGKEGYTLAAILLLGKNELIHSALPHYKIDALVRIENLTRYDDREYIDTNLIDAYEKLMDFVAKHLPDKFYLEVDQRVSVRSKIFREIVANLIVHREYMDAHPATFIIYKDRVETVNANNPHGEGIISPDNFTPFPKNPTIAKFFAQLGRVDELGSGIINVNRFIRNYSGNVKPQFIEGNPFKMVIPLTDKKTDGTNVGVVDGVNVGVVVGVIDGVTDDVKDKIGELLTVIINDEGKRLPDYLKNFSVTSRTLERYIEKLNEADLIEFRGSANSGGYFITQKTKDLLSNS